MRVITEHHTNTANRAITIEADEPDPENGNASHSYQLTWHEKDGGDFGAIVAFQHGPIKENGVNGVTNEVLLCIVIDRLRGFQSSKFACEENADALAHLEAGFAALEKRTRNREQRQVEGTHEV